MDNKNHVHAYQVIYRVLYLGGVFLLLAGMLLSFVDGSVQAGGLDGSYRHATATPRVRNGSEQKSNDESSYQKQHTKAANSKEEKPESESEENVNENKEQEGGQKTPTPVKLPTEVENPTEANESAATQEVTQTPTQTPQETQAPTETAAETSTSVPQETQIPTETVTQAPTSAPQETQVVTATPAETSTSVPQETQSVTTTPTETSTSAPQETQAASATPAASQVPGNVTGSVSFADTSTDLCLFVPTTLEDTAVVSLSGGSAILQTAWRVTAPADLSTAENVSEFKVSNGDSINVTGEWPGVRPTDTAVTVHFRAVLLDAVSRSPISSEAGADFTWTSSFCAPPVAAASNLPSSASGSAPAVSVPNTGSLAALPSPTPPPTVMPVSNIPVANGSSVVSGSVTHFSIPNTGFLATAASPTTPPTVMPSFVATQTGTLGVRSSPSPTVTAQPTTTRTQAVPVTGGQATATLGPVAIPPTAAAGQQQLVPVTGEDLTPAHVPFAGLSLAQRITLYLGLVFVGIAFILQGLSRRK